MSMKRKLTGRICIAVILAMILAVTFAACDKKAVDRSMERVTSAAVTAKNKGDYNFADQAKKYLHIIGTKYKNRSMKATKEDKSNNKHEEAREWIVSELEKAGYSGDCLEEQKFNYENSVNGENGTNVVATIPGRDESKQVIVGSHYDGDGAGDNGTGVSLLLANASGLVKSKPQYTVKFIFFDGEEEGMLGSNYYVDNMSAEEKANTLYMINMDSLGFGDYCNVYGGVADYGDLSAKVKDTEAFDFVMKKAKALGFKTYGTDKLEAYYDKHGAGPEVEDDAIYTNPWTSKHQSPANFIVPSPATGDWSDHVPFKKANIKYVYFEATNWFTKGDGGQDAYTGYFDTSRSDLGEKGMFMNTPFDTLDNLNKYFPGRVEAHFNLYSPLLSSLLIDAWEIEK